MPSPVAPSVTLPEGTVDLELEVVPAVRAMLGRGLPEDFVRACVRVGAFTSFGGGMKSALVGGLRIDVNAAMKVGDAELDQHVILMERVNRSRARTFPAVQALVKLDGGRRLLFMEQLLGHETLLDFVYRRPTPKRDLDRILDTVLDGVRAIRRAGRESARALARLPRTKDPYGPRLRDRFARLRAEDPELCAIESRAGVALGERVPPLAELLDEVDAFLRDALPSVPSTLCHGDLHLANVMARRRGRGFSVRFLDPNPTIGMSDPLYDAGKLLHWAEPVGWLAVDERACRARFRTTPGDYRFDARVVGVAASAERRRAGLESAVRARLAAVRRRDASRAPRLEIAIASAHVGMAALFRGKEREHARRFALAHALAALGRFHRLGANAPPSGS